MLYPNACHLTPHFTSQVFLSSSISMSLSQFDSTAWRGAVFLFLKMGFLNEQRFPFIQKKSVQHRLKAKRAHNTSCQTTMALNSFEMLPVWNGNISIQTMAITQSTWKWIEPQYSHARFIKMYNFATFCYIRYALVLIPGDLAAIQSAPTHPLLLPALISHLKTRAHDLRPSVCFFWGNVTPKGIWTYVIKKRGIRALNLQHVLITWGRPHLHRL